MRMIQTESLSIHLELNRWVLVLVALVELLVVLVHQRIHRPFAVLRGRRTLVPLTVVAFVEELVKELVEELVEGLVGRTDCTAHRRSLLESAFAFENLVRRQYLQLLP